MQFPTVFLSVLALTPFVAALPAPGFSPNPLHARAAIKVETDTSTVTITPAVVGAAPAQPDDVGGKADAAGAVADVVGKVVKLVQGLVNNDLERRRRFTQETAVALSVQFPDQNVVVSNVGYELTGVPTVKFSTSYNAKVGSNVSFDVLVFGKGLKFTLKGDGGFENWAFITYGCTRTGKVIQC